MIARILLFSTTVLLSGCLIMTDQKTGVSKKLTLSGIETIAPIVETDRKQLPRLDIHKFESGFTANGISYFDPEGRIIHLSEVSDTGSVTYTIEGNNKFEYIVKLVNPLQGDGAKVLGSLEQEDDKWHYQPTGEKRYSGNWFRLASRGVLLNESDNVVTYFSLDHPTQTHVLPDGYGFTPLQKGDISTSLHLLIQRPIPSDFKMDLGVMDLNFSEGVRKFDFILFNLVNGKTTAKIHNIRLRGLTENENMGHLASSYYLFNTPSGTIIVTLEDDYDRFVIRNLTTGQKKIAFERESGVSYTKAVMHSSGRIELKASLGLSDDKVLDVENYLLTGNRNKQLGEL